jgi:short-subunit dehydrogenase
VQLPNSVVIVTGAASGIGRATATALADRGARVVAVDRDGEALAKLAADIGCQIVEVDVTDPAHGERLVAETLRQHGRVDAVVANAGIGYVGQFAEMPVELISSLLHINLRAPMLLIRAALPQMLEQGDGGAIVITTSIGAAVPVPTEAAYGVSKTALESFATALRGEVRPAGIKVSTIQPGVVRTAFHEARNEPYERRFPRPMPPERVAAVILDVLQSGAERRTVPRWLEVAVRFNRTAPGLYSALARRFS